MDAIVFAALVPGGVADAPVLEQPTADPVVSGAACEAGRQAAEQRVSGAAVHPTASEPVLEASAPGEPEVSAPEAATDALEAGAADSSVQGRRLGAPVPEPAEEVFGNRDTTPEPEAVASATEAGGTDPTTLVRAVGDPAPEAVPAPRGFVPPPVLTRPVNSLHHARELPGQEWAVPDTVIDEADYEGLHLRAASLRGDKHRYERSTRQDAFGLHEIEHSGHRFVLACVADGVGSRPRSHRGAAYVCRMLHNVVAENMESLGEDVQEGGRRVVGVLARGMIDLAGREHFPADELSTTLTAVLIRVPEGEGRAPYLTMSVGDSPLFRLKDGVWRPLNVEPDEDGLILDTRTDALPDQASTVVVQTGELDLGDVLMLCTDGLSGPMGAPAVAEQLADWWGAGPVPGRMEFGWQLDFQAKSYNDDRTAVCVWRR
ncbi:protein phosphatase 2C domain-containing protein [Nocardiopsis dassonvillei]|uniref:protein phosphatase 2C domain-containing protein n=1 Tax=Nocardiopsis dassonvillei TaxID=2014 RepID=UPI003F54357C